MASAAKRLIEKAERADWRGAARRSRAAIGAVVDFSAEERPIVDPARRRGRGALSNPSGRFEREQRVASDDGWNTFDEPEALRTNIHVERARTIVTRNDSPDISFDRSVNPYRGCEHGCVYCYARPTHAYMGLSSGLDFETEIFVKEGAAQLLERELSAPGYSPKTIAIGANTDPYQPVEKRYRITRGLLEVASRADHPIGIVTKSSLVTRDIDLLAPMARKGLVKVAISVTTLDPALARAMEPRAAAPERRLATIEALSAAGIPVTVLVAPIIPGINDAEIETILTRAHAAGAREAGYVMLRLPLELREVFSEWLVTHFPDKARHVLSLVRSARDGKLYDPSFDKRMTGDGPYAWMLGRRFEVAAARLGFSHTRLRSDLFRAPRCGAEQLSLF
ncbi:MULTISPECIES: PA0069 family radical SAM protein [Methylosinus]|uniref:Radical SAM protein n=1 Tax=Methylosinus trichosporium (strain ATCC 35070 / NCIMB 11131 / UNIQEM 75 / OB3b) TaxID=595536 RepID=A0A2D2CZ93_METT3|nr:MULTISPECIES: PA0069 family radical SAM protein [Methylosinus]ATQ68035.1 radical SAM protein [Methylosinus trichosporium OB3b]